MILIQGGFIVHRGGEGYKARGPLGEQAGESRVYFEGDDRRWVWRDSVVFGGTREECTELADALNKVKAEFYAKLKALQDQYDGVLADRIASAEALQ